MLRVLWYLFLIVATLYGHYNTSTYFASGVHLGHRVTHRHRAGHWMGDWDIQDMNYRQAHPNG